MDRVKETINRYEKKNKKSIEQHLQELRVKREELENLKSENSQFLQDNNVVEIIRAREARMNQMEAASQPYISKLVVPTKREILEGTNTYIQIQYLSYFD